MVNGSASRRSKQVVPDWAADTGRSHRALTDRGKLHDSIVDFYESQIFSEKLKVGGRLPSEAEIGRHFAVSTRTVRDAMQVLETKGLVQRKHGEYTIVVRNDVAGFLGSLALSVRQLLSADPTYFLELMDVRRIIELDVVGQLAAPDGHVTAEVEQALIGMRAAAATGDCGGFAQRDAAFHLGLVHSTSNKVLHILYENLHALISDVIRVTSRVPDKSLDIAYREHAHIHQLIQAKDVLGARAAISQHIEGSAGYLRVALQAAKAAHVRDETRSLTISKRRLKA